MTRKKVTDSEEGEDIPVKKDDLVALVGTGKVKFMPKGQKFTAHRIQADKLVASGKATEFKQSKESAE